MQKQTDPEALPTLQTLLEALAPIAQCVMMDLPAEKDKETLKAWLELYISLNVLSKKVADRMGEMKPHFHEVAEALGVQNEKGGFEMLLDGHSLLREKRVATDPDADLLKAHLESRGLDRLACFDTQQTLVFNASKLRFLIETGKVHEEDIQRLHAVGWAIKAVPNKTLKDKLEGLFKKPRKKAAVKNARVKK